MRKAVLISASLLALLCYVSPFIYIYPPFIESDYSKEDIERLTYILDLVFAVGTSLSIGLILIAISIPLKDYQTAISLSAGGFFVGLSLIFLLNNLTDSEFKTYNYVLFNILITTICLVILLLRQASIRR